MRSLTPIARWTGAAYLMLALAGILGILVIRPQIFLASDPGATLDNIAKSGGLAELGVVLELLIVAAQALSAVGFYALFRRENPVAAFAVAAFGLLNSAAILGSAAMLGTAVRIAADPASTLGASAADMVALLFVISEGFWACGALFFGLWLIPMGWYIVSTRQMPRPLGWVLMIGGAAYVASAVLDAAFPGAPVALIDALSWGASVGEFWIIGYLLICGIRRQQEQ